MTFINHATRPTVDAVALNHLSGLNRQGIDFHCDCFQVMLTAMRLQARKEKRSVIFKRAESYVKEYRDAEREKIRLSRLSKQNGSYYVPAEPKLVFIVRIKG